jgi:diguanylate cyclase (GGDEF)-like protein/PAS domain S-box-containing protein
MRLFPKFYQASYQQPIVAELVQLIYSQAMPAIVGSFVVASCLVYILYGVVPNSYLFSWYALIAVMTLVRYSVVKFYFINKPLPAQSLRWEKYFVSITLFAGLCWGVVSTVLIPERSMDQAFIACTLAGVAAGAIPFFSGSRVACCVFVIPVLLPFAVWSFAQGDSLHQMLGALTLVYLSLLLISCFRTHAAIYKAIKLNHENTALIERLTNTQQEMLAINKNLQKEVNFRADTEKLLKESEAQYRLVTDALPVLISYVDISLRYRFINKAYTDWFGEEVDSIVGQTMQRVLGDSTFAMFQEHIGKLPNNNVINFETVMQFRQQEERYVSVSLVPHVIDGDVRGFFSLISDMTPRINYLATHDALTDLPNRSLFNAKFSQSLKRAQRMNFNVVLFYVDLDHFKNINDTLGHDVGDILLVKVVERIKQGLREKDMLARIGGDEFIILLEKISNENIIKAAQRVCNAFSTPFNLNNNEVFVTASIGISIYPDDGHEMSVLLKNADMAAYRAKERGRNTFEFYTDEMNKKILNKIDMECKLRVALDKNEFSLDYQPVMDIPSNSITSLEALIRWNHPVEGFIPPESFIPVAEESGLIVPIGEWVIRAVCQQNSNWHQHGNFPVDLHVSINLSARQFKAKNLVAMISNILEETGMPGKFITLELTEALVMHDIQYSTRTIKALKDLDILLSLDDFGTGYSSIKYLRHFPIDIIKIDKSFVADITKKSDDASIVIAIIAMAHSFKMRVIAEGVETLQQYHFLKEHGCDEIQGYLLSKPMPPQEIAVFLKNAFSVEEYLKSQSH